MADTHLPNPNPSSGLPEGTTHRSYLSRRLGDVADAFAFAYDALRVNKVRTGLTALGMVIGTASVILVATIALTSPRCRSSFAALT